MRVQSLLALRSEFDAIASAADTTPAYLIQVAYGHSLASATLSKRIELATSGRVTRSELRPDVFGGTEAN